MRWSALRHAHLWLPGYLRTRRRDAPEVLWVAIGDHYEPFWKDADESTAAARVEQWRRKWPEIAARQRDSQGRPACYTFFYAEEHYRPHLLDALASMVREGIADVEVHLHHDGESEPDFVARMRGFLQTLSARHGLLRQDGGRTVFAFIHGNWALDNSRPDGRWCGLNNELTLLRDLGCYADFTLPSAPHPTQTRMVNTIYWATDDPRRPKSHDTGMPVTPGGPDRGDLLMIPGPLGLDWQERRWAPRLETGELASYHRPSRARAALWLQLAPRIGGQAFLKLFTHGAQESHMRTLLEGDLDATFEHLRAECVARGVQLRFVSAYDLWRAVRAVGFPAASRAEVHQ
jgi:hypothetical protein